MRLVVFQEMKDETMLEESLRVDEDAWTDVIVGKMKDLPPPTKTQARVSKPQYRRLFERSYMFGFNGLL